MQQAKPHLLIDLTFDTDVLRVARSAVSNSSDGSYSVSLLNEVHLDYVWLKGKGENPVLHDAENRYIST